MTKKIPSIFDALVSEWTTNLPEGLEEFDRIEREDVHWSDVATDWDDPEELIYAAARMAGLPDDETVALTPAQEAALDDETLILLLEATARHIARIGACPGCMADRLYDLAGGSEPDGDDDLTLH